MTDNSYQTGFSKTWMLFESGNGVAVDLSLFSGPRESPRPIDAYVVTEVEGSVTRSARRAAGAVYEAISRDRSGLEPVVAGFDFAGSSPVTGESGGLAFAVALAKRLMREDPGPVAATGIVQSSHNGGPVKGVRGIAAKLEAAAVALSSEGWILYPAENDVEIPSQLRERLMEQGLRLFPVSSVAEALGVLFPKKPRELLKHSLKSVHGAKKAYFFIYTSFLLMLFFFAVGLAVWNGYKKSQKPDLTNGAMQTKRSSEEEPAEDEGDKIATVINENGKPKTAQMKNHLDTKIGEMLDASHPVIIDIFGRTRLNAQISHRLASKLRDFFSEKNHHLGPVDQVEISGQVYVLKIEETWEEEQRNFKSSLKVVLRDFVYKDDSKTAPRLDIEVDVQGIGMVEDLISAAAQKLMNRILDALPSKRKSGVEKREEDAVNLIEEQSRPSSRHGFD